MTEIVINRCRRGTLLSEAGCIEYADRKGTMPETLDRADPVLVQMMREDKGKRIWGGHCSHVEIITIPDGVKWCVQSSGNEEWVAALDG